MAASSSDGEDSDVEKNFALLMERGAEEEDGEDEEEDGEDEEEDGEDDEDEGPAMETREDIKKELSNMSFEDVMKLQKEVGTKVYQEVAYGAAKRPHGAAKHKRLNKNRPMEMSSKRAAPFLRQVAGVKKAMRRDPRFDDLSGEYKADVFERTYGFIHDIRRQEAQVIKKQLKKTEKGEKKEKLNSLLKKMANQERARRSAEQQRERALQFKKEQRERANQGAQPFFLNKSAEKKVRLAEKYKELKKSGKLENFLSKKRKKNALKDRRKLPWQQQHK
ncbi:ribosomal RNA processing protein 36 homolog [Nerophis ophidion]|uniref:ribosomal RNA processing protein 36 homolog n=1 Tax=Nerophis ophidion TaxID=159077 RepID=UPI002ADF251D|nr:ribosomal RNA processing protein 36 homolog [Nerophis ophidion]XP_061736740.1 ribosomal RNA processing protein 36 homolog [Nerophis ophidion]